MNLAEIDNLAKTVYPIILPCARQTNGSISYSDVCTNLHGSKWVGIGPRSVLLASALGAIVSKCRNASPPLPELSAVVVHASGDK